MVKDRNSISTSELEELYEFLLKTAGAIKNELKNRYREENTVEVKQQGIRKV